MKNKTHLKEIKSDASLALSKNCALISLTATPEILPILRSTASEYLDVPEEQLEGVLNNPLLLSHTVPVCIPLIGSPEELDNYLKVNSIKLLDMLLSAWPFPISSWEINTKNVDVFKELVEVRYFPIICKAIAKKVENTLDLAVTFAVPTPALIQYLTESIASKKMKVSDKELSQLDFLTACGVAIVTNKIERSPQQDANDYVTMLNDSKSYLSELENDILKTLFYFYFKNENNMPAERDNEHLNEWFDTQTYAGMYIL